MTRPSKRTARSLASKSVAQRRPLPRTKEEWRARVRDALDFGERVQPPLPEGRELIHRVFLLAAVAAVTAMFVALASTPGIAIIGSTMHSLAERFSGPIETTDLPAIAQRSVILDRNGKVIATLSEENRMYVKLSRVPLVAQQAVIATEDAKFYSHHGVDLAGLVRAMLFNFRTGSVRQGGSTITQQLVKTATDQRERTLDRKIREARRAVRLEQAYTKQQILEEYLNRTLYGRGVYGIGTAAEFYFGQPVEKLNLPQSALLAGIIQSPEDDDPIRHPKAAFARRNIALQRMADVGFISQKTADRTKKLSIGATAHNLPQAKDPSYFVQYIRRLISQDPAFGKTPDERDATLLTGGLRVETTLDLDLEKKARSAIDGVMKKLKLKDAPLAALVSIEPSTGAIRAIIGDGVYGGVNYELAQQKPGREPGSTFKTMTLVAALDNGITPSLVFDTPSPLTIPGEDGKPWTVNNFEKKGEGFIDLREATAHSVNTYYAQLIKRIGPDKVVAEARKLGITTSLPAVDALTLGAHSVTPLDLTSAYSTLANAGTHCAPFAITRIKDSTGKTVEENAPACERVISANVAATATDILRGVIGHGTAATNGDIGRQAAGKTGTTDKHVDAWFAGYTPQFATVVWMGYPKDETRPLAFAGYPKGVTGGTLPTMMWSSFMRAAHRGLRVEHFQAPPSFPLVTVPPVTGKALDEARTTLDAAGFPTTKIVSENSGRPAGTVLAQEPAGDTRAPGGALITLHVAGAAPAPPSPAPSPKPSPTPSSSPTPSPQPSPSKSKKS